MQRGLGDPVRGHDERRLSLDPAAFDPRHEIRQRSEAVVKTIFSASSPVLRAELEPRRDEPQRRRERVRRELTEPKSFPERPAHFITLERLGEPRPEARRLALNIDLELQVDAPRLNTRRIPPHGFTAEEALARRDVELPVVPLAGKNAVFAGARRERIPLVRAAIVKRRDPFPSAGTQATRWPPAFRRTGRPSGKSSRGPRSCAKLAVMPLLTPCGYLLYTSLAARTSATATHWRMVLYWRGLSPTGTT